VRRALLEQRRNLALACAPSALAGYVDSIGLLDLGGLYVSFMSGNSTRLGLIVFADQYAAGLTADTACPN
jgi:uncharacterized membrane protein YoaK (UPF0700 family)